MNDNLTTKEFDIIMEGDIEVINERTIKNPHIANKMCVSENPSQDRNYGDIAYFKVYDHTDPDTAKHCSRITFKSPAEYVSHKSSKPPFILNNNDKKLEILLKSPYNDQLTNWQFLIISFNGGVQDKYKLDPNLPIPDFSYL